MNENEQPSQLYMSNMEESTGLPFELCESLSEELINIITYSSQTDGVCTLPNSSIGVTDALRFWKCLFQKSMRLTPARQTHGTFHRVISLPTFAMER